jgi:hypothetical protein
MSKIEIQVRGQTYACPAISNEHAFFFGTLLMDEEELRCYIVQEKPDLAMEMMRDRLAKTSDTLRKVLEQQDLTSEQILERINDDAIQQIVKRLIVRINQDQMPGNLVTGIRYKVAQRLREIFPELPLNLVGPQLLNLEAEELVTAIALPLFATMAQKAPELEATTEQAEAVPTAKKKKAFKAAVAEATPAAEPTQTDLAIQALERQIAELKQKAGQEVSA